MIIITLVIYGSVVSLRMESIEAGGRTNSYTVRHIVQDSCHRSGRGFCCTTCAYNCVRKYSGSTASPALLVFGLLRATGMVL